MTVEVKRRGVLLCLVGPAGGGKTSHGEQLLRTNANTLVLSVSATSRAPRPAEQDGVHYHFIDRAEFERRIKAGEFFEHEEVHGNLYGTLRSTLTDAISSGTDLLLDVDIRGALTFKRQYPRECVVIFLVPPSFAVLRERIIARGPTSPKELETRVGTAKCEYEALFNTLSEPGLIDYFVVNDDRTKALATLSAILVAERVRLARMAEADLRRICVVDPV